LGRGRGRGMGISNATASPVSSPVYPSSACFETIYDGVDDGYLSSDAAFKIVGNQTWALEAYIETASANRAILSQWDAATGMLIQVQAGNTLFFYGNGATKNFSTSITGILNTWAKVILFYNGTSMEAYINGVSVGSVLLTLLTSTTDFRISNFSGAAGGRFYDGGIRNLEVYSGFPSNPAAWIPGDTASMSGVTLVMQSADGNGSNGQGEVFTELGAPVTQDCT